MKKHFIVDGMHCDHCVRRIKEKLESIEGVLAVEINLDSATMTLDITDHVSIDSIIKAVKELGYQASIAPSNDEITLSITGMTCGHCGKKIENALMNHQGIQSVAIDLDHHRAHILYNKHQITIEDMTSIIRSSGYDVDDSSLSKPLVQVNQSRPVNLIIIIILTALVLILSISHMASLRLPSLISPDESPEIFVILQFLLTLPILYIGRDLFRKSFINLIKGILNMDSLIVLGILSAFIYSFYGFIAILSTGQMHILYFETSAIIMTITKIGKHLESVSKTKASSTIRDLLKLTPDKALVMAGDQPISSPVSEIEVGQHVLVNANAHIPIDGVIIEGSSSIDASMITGDLKPIHKEHGQMVMAGTMNLSEAIVIKAQRIGKDTTLSKIVDLVEKAEMSKAPIAQTIDRISAYYIPIVVAISMISFVVWLILGQSFEFALKIALSTLIVSCPGALGLATPTAMIVGTGTAAKHGILFKSGETIQKTQKINTIVFDKTVTLTENKPHVNEVVALDIDESLLLKLIVSAEKDSMHPLAKAIRNLASKNGIDLIQLNQVKERPGKGIEFTYEDNTYYFGSRKYLKQHKISFKNIKISTTSESIIYLGAQEKVLAYVTILDSVKKDALEMIEKIHQLGIETHILSGDNYEATAMVANALNVKRIHANILPEDKHKEIIKLQKLGYRVAMVGDGMNDELALQQADIGISLTSSNDLSLAPADIVLINHKLLDIVTALNMSKKMIGNIKQNYFWSFAFHILGIFIGLGIIYGLGGPLLSPTIALIIISLSSITVLMNALRIKKYISR
jgi:Cu+-exporting ATPase